MAQPEAPGYYSGYGTPPPPEQPNRNVGLIIGAIIAVAVLIMIAGGVIAAVYVSNRGESDEGVVTDASSAPAADAPTGSTSGDTTTDSSAPTSGRGTVGKPIRQGDLVITVLNKPRCGVKSVGEGYSISEPRQGQFCLIDLQFQNTGSKAVQPDYLSNKVIDENGGEFLYEYSASKDANPDRKLPLYENIYQGQTVTGIIVFDLPADQTPATLEMNPVGELTDKIEISLK